MEMNATASFALPEDGGVLVGRIWRLDLGGPSVVAVRDGVVFDITKAVPTMSELREAEGERLMPVGELLAGTPRAARKPGKPWLVAPTDLQAIKAAGVTFAVSMLERVIEERARGAPEQAVSLRAEITGMIGDDLSRLKPGSPQAMALKDLLIKKGMWSQYLEVGIGPDAEVFTKAPPMAAVGHLAEVGIHPMSTWNNPEPEVVVVVNAAGAIVGAALGNDVNLRDVEGRSALLLGKAKDNNASASIGPFIRLFDDTFSLDDVRRATVSLTVEGEDGFKLEGKSDMGRISRDPADLVASTIGSHHQYPDGFVLYLGTMFAPIQDRDGKGQGFTHKVGDVVTIASPKLGRLANRVVHCGDAEAWTFGTGALMRNLAARGVI
ncbi:MAG: fumarylacetoacetate hydrolase family protein [Rhizobiales bacterium]|nr:fumarylacetoacetate hydrolase family protein [Hyphomicrobiales bacterium]